MLPNRLISEQDRQGLLLTTITALDDGSFMASAVNGGILYIPQDGDWIRTDYGLPEHAVIHMLETVDGTVYACTNKGLFMLEEDRWKQTNIGVPCYRLRGSGGVLYAAAEDGLWYMIHERWVRTDYAEGAVYDVFLSPQMIFMAQKEGLAVYDRYTQSYAYFPMACPVSSLTVLHGRLVAAGANGSLMIGNKKGGFDLFQYGNIGIFSIAAAKGRVYACTNKGLYRLIGWNGHYHLCSVKLGYPVTDLACHDGQLLLSTYLGGIQTITLEQ